jgi:hypothetical protein
LSAISDIWQNRDNEEQMKSKGIWVLVSVLVAAILLITVFGCSSSKTTTLASTTTSSTTAKLAISPDGYVFIDHHVDTRGELIEGKYPFMYIDFPGYFFDGGTLTGQFDFKIDDTLKMIYGAYNSLSGCAGTGISSSLYSANVLPYENNGFKILGIQPDGTAQIEYNGVSIILKSGESWEQTTSRIDTKESQGQSGTAKLTTTDTIVNYGILDKSKIKYETLY